MSNPEPRQMQEIMQEYNKTAAEAGQLQYQVYVFQKDLESKNYKLLELNKEAAARQDLNKTAVSAQGAANEQS